MEKLMEKNTGRRFCPWFFYINFVGNVFRSQEQQVRFLDFRAVNLLVWCKVVAKWSDLNEKRIVIYGSPGYQTLWNSDWWFWRCFMPTDGRTYSHSNICTRVGTLIVATIYLQLIQNRYMFRSFTVLQCSHQHCVQPVASDVEVVGYL